MNIPPSENPNGSKKRNNRGLGMGVDALFLNDEESPSKKNDRIFSLSVQAIVPGRYQPRKLFDDLASKELTESIRQHGVLQPILVRHNPDQNNYELIAGERRWRSACAAGLETIPAIIKTMDKKNMMLIGLIENLQRENLNCLEEAEGIEKIVEEHQMTHEKIAELLSKSRSAITNSLRLLDLSNPVKEKLRQNQLEMGHARALLSLPDGAQKKLSDLIVKDSLSVREVEKRVKHFSSEKESNKRSESKHISEKDNETQQFIQEIEEFFGLPIKYLVNKNGKGYVRFDFSNKKQFLALLDYLKKTSYSQEFTG